MEFFSFVVVVVVVFAFYLVMFLLLPVLLSLKTKRCHVTLKASYVRMP